MTAPKAPLGLLMLLLAAPALPGLEGEASLTVGRSLAAVVAGPPGTPAQEVGADRTRIEAVAGHKQTLGAGWSAEALAEFHLDSLPSNNPRILPEAKLEPLARILEAWLGWEPVPGVLAVGAGKRRIQPSSGFSGKPLDVLGREDDREGRTGVQAAWYTGAGSVSVFGGPGWKEDGTADAFVLGRAGLTWGGADVKVQLYRSSGVPRAGAGVDGSWGDHLTLRAEAAADADGGRPRTEALAGLTWTADDLSTVMAEAAWDERDEARCTGFLRATADLGQDWEARAWLKAEVPAADWSRPSGWTGLGLGWKGSRWTLDAGWTGAWGPPGTTAGDSPFRWKTEVTAKVLF